MTLNRKPTHSWWMTITSITRIASGCVEKENTVAKRARRKIEFVSKVPMISSGRKLFASHEDSQTVSEKRDVSR